MNLYGFANGDPVNFSDPFGLCPPWPSCLAQGLANWGARQGGVTGWLALNGGAALNAGFEASGINGAAAAGEAIGSGDVGGGLLAAGLELVPLGKLARGGRVVIGKLDDLGRLGLKPGLPNLGSPGANWRQNASALRQAMRSGQPIMDASTDPRTGELINNTGFLRAERELLQNRGWTYDASTRLWSAPTPQ